MIYLCLTFRWGLQRITRDLISEGMDDGNKNHFVNRKVIKGELHWAKWGQATLLFLESGYGDFLLV